MLENVDKWWGIAAIVGGLLSTLLVTIVTATSDNDPATPETRWQSALRVLATIITRVFSLSTYRNEGTKEGFEFSMPFFGSATPTTDAKKALEGPQK